MSLIKMKCKNKKCVRISPNQCTQKKQEASFCICKKGSLTVEAAVVLPLTIGFLLTILWFFRVLFIQEAVEEALIYTGRILAVESVWTDSEEVLYVSAEGLLKQKLLQNEDVKRFVSGTVLGVSLFGSNLSGKEIQLTATYMVKLPITFFGKRGIWLTSKNSFMKWKGNLYAGSGEDAWVYITETGTVYHKNTSCRSLDLHIQEVMLKKMSSYRGSNGQKYKVCKRCMDVEDKNMIVYVTDYGKLYHGDLLCSSLKRTILRVLLSEAEDKNPCSFCYE